MQFKFFVIPAVAGDEVEKNLNHFLSTVTVVEVEKHFQMVECMPSWCMCISFLPLQPQTQIGDERFRKKSKIDYKEILSAESFARFEKLRKVRREISEENTIPPYLIFTDAELSMIASMENPTPEKIAKLDGINKGRAKSYGAIILERIGPVTTSEIEVQDETGGVPF